MEISKSSYKLDSKEFDQALELMCNKNKNLVWMKKEITVKNDGYSRMVTRTGLEPVLFAVKGQRVNQLHQRAKKEVQM